MKLSERHAFVVVILVALSLLGPFAQEAKSPDSAASPQNPSSYEIVTAVIPVQNVDVDEIVTVLHSFRNTLGGSISVSEKLRTISVSGSPAFVEACKEAAKKLDVPQPAAKSIELTFTVLVASKVGSGGQDIPVELQGVVEQLRKLAAFKHVRVADAQVAQVREGGSVEVQGVLYPMEQDVAQIAYSIDTKSANRFVSDSKVRIRLAQLMMAARVETRTDKSSALTIAGSDCSGGAGIQADLKTFHSFGVFGMSAVTAVVAENTAGVRGVSPIAPEFAAMQIDSCLEDIGADAVKTGMLVDAAMIKAVAERLRRHGIGNLVVDPVMRAKGGDPLLAPEAASALVSEIFPLALVVTPNIEEAEALWGRPIASEADIRKAAEAIRSMGPKAVVMKGGHSPVNPEGLSVDFLWDGKEWLGFEGERSSNRNTHGTGCTFSAAIAASLALGHELREAVAAAKRYITNAIATAPGLGHGHGPVNHWAGG